jgi:hypothetical protein
MMFLKNLKKGVRGPMPKPSPFLRESEVGDAKSVDGGRRDHPMRPVAGPR